MLFGVAPVAAGVLTLHATDRCHTTSYDVLGRDCRSFLVVATGPYRTTWNFLNPIPVIRKNMS